MGIVFLVLFTNSTTIFELFSFVGVLKRLLQNWIVFGNLCHVERREYVDHVDQVPSFYVGVASVTERQLKNCNGAPETDVSDLPLYIWIWKIK